MQNIVSVANQRPTWLIHDAEVGMKCCTPCYTLVAYVAKLLSTLTDCAGLSLCLGFPGCTTNRSEAVLPSVIADA